MMINKLKVGDKVITKAGDRIAGPPGLCTVVKVGKRWGDFPAVVCEKPNGDKKLFLVKNLLKIEVGRK